MRIEFAEQYNRCCVVIDGTETFGEVQRKCLESEATYNDGEDICLVVQFPNRPMELYTEEALQRSLPGGH